VNKTKSRERIKEMQRLKKDAIPTKMLILEKKRKMPDHKVKVID